jgi:hypothetical protein
LCWETGDDDDASSRRDSMLGRVIGGDASYSRDSEDADGQEPLALLVIHAAMHMLFLPQFTCEFYEENNEADLDANDSGSLDSQNNDRKRPDSARSEGIEKNEEEDDDDDEEAKRLAGLAEEVEAERDIFMQKEAGLTETKYVDSGILLLPRPTTIVWAGGIGLKPNKVQSNHLRHCKNLQLHTHFLSQFCLLFYRRSMMQTCINLTKIEWKFCDYYLQHVVIHSLHQDMSIIH